jgi:uncharacterized protein
LANSADWGCPSQIHGGLLHEGISIIQGITILRTLIQGAATVTLAISLLLQAVVSGRTSDLIEGLTRYAMREHARAIEVLRPLADQGDAVAQEILGKIHLTGEGTTRDNIVAFKRFLQAAERGRAEAQLELGRMYRDGVGILADGNLAMYWFHRAAKQGTPDAYNAIGELYLGHPDVLEDAAAARRFFLGGANLDNAGAMCNLGMIYLVGHGVTQDGIEAYKCLSFQRKRAKGKSAILLFARSARSENALLPCKSEWQWLQ